jgi:type IV pilus assembly protein PilA
MIVKGGEHMFKRFMRKEKGFTLVELLAVIVILGIILAIAIPAIGNVIDNSKTEAIDANEKLIENAARLANVSGLALETKGTDKGYYLKTLKDNGYLEDIPEDPKSGNVYDDTKFVTATTDATSNVTKFNIDLN